MGSDFQPLLGSELDQPGIDEVLTDAGVGVLSMSDEGVPYGVPMSFGYDGEDSLYFVFLGSAELRKETYAEMSDVASFTTFEINADSSWRSVIVSGPLERITIDEWDEAREAMADNAYQSSLLTEYELQENPNVWALRTTERGGRAVGQD